MKFQMKHQVRGNLVRMQRALHSNTPSKPPQQMCQVHDRMPEILKGLQNFTTPHACTRERNEVIKLQLDPPWPPRAVILPSRIPSAPTSQSAIRKAPSQAKPNKIDTSTCQVNHIQPLHCQTPHQREVGRETKEKVLLSIYCHRFASSQ